MRRNLRAVSAYKLTLMAAVMVLVFCAGLASYAQSTVSGTVTRGGIPCPDARVVLNDTSGASMTTKTDSSGHYSFAGVATGGTCSITANAIKAVPVVDQSVNVNDVNVTANIDLPYGRTPLYDDFSETEVDMSKWEPFNSVISGFSTDAVVSTTGGMLNIDAAPVRGGIISKTAFPKCGSYEYVLPKIYQGENQCFCIIKDKFSNYSNYFDLQDHAATSTNPNLNCWVDGMNLWQKASPCAYPARITVLKTGSHFDVFVNDVWLGEGNNDLVADDAYIYLYGYEAADATTGTVAYFDNIKAGAAVPVAFNTVAEARAAAADTPVSINNVIITASTTNAFWVENSDRSSGIKVISTAKPTVGQKAIIFGKIVKQNNEVALQADDIVTAGSFSVPAVAITGKVANEFDKAGATAQGLFVKVSGKVTEVVNSTDNTKIAGYYLDDGSGITAGNHKGLYVKVDDSTNLPAGFIRVGEFLAREGPMTVFMADSTTPVPSIITTKGIDYVPTFTAYNDLAYFASNGPATNITKYSFANYNGSANDVPGGFLKDYASGNYVSERVTVTSYNLAPILTNGANPVAGSDAEKYFANLSDPANPQWIVNFAGTPYAYNVPYNHWWMDITFEGLDPNVLYEFVGTVNKNEINGLFCSEFIILDYTDRTYACSAMANKINDDTVWFNCSDNSAGYVARWINIKPSASGTFRVRSQSYNVARGYALSAFRLRKQADVETP